MARREFHPRVNPWRDDFPPPRLTKEHEEEFIGLRPGEISVLGVSFRPYDEPYDFEKMNGKGVERYKMMFPIGMQFSKAGEEDGIGVEQVQTEGYMLGDLKEIMGEEGEGSVWEPADGALQVISGERCTFRVEA